MEFQFWSNFRNECSSLELGKFERKNFLDFILEKIELVENYLLF